MNLANAAGPPASSMALSRAGSRICSVAMPELKHYFTSDVKHCLIPSARPGADNQLMLDSPELARRLKIAMDTHEPRITSVRMAEVCKITPQGVNGWRKTGRIAKRHLTKIAAETGQPYGYFLEAAPGAPADYSLKPDEKIMLDRYRLASPRWRAALRDMATLHADVQDEIAEKLSILYAEIFAKHAADTRVKESFGRPPNAESVIEK